MEMTDERNITLLYIDDNEEQCLFFKKLSQAAGWHFLMAQNAQAGLAAFRQHMPQLVLIDCSRPYTEGLEAVRGFHALSAAVPVLVLSSEDDQKLADSFAQAGASDWVVKPIKASDILSRLRLHIMILEHQQAFLVDKGINQATLALIRHHLAQQIKPVSSREISEGTGLAYQTVSRYLQHMVAYKMIHMESNYGKVGRPQQLYSLLP